METKFTKGQWNYDNNVSESYFPIYDEFGGLIAEVNDHRPLTGLISSLTKEEKIEFTANAKLIAAAPDLFKMLEDALHTIKALNNINVSYGGVSQDTIIIEIENVLKKATE